LQKAFSTMTAFTPIATAPTQRNRRIMAGLLGRGILESRTPWMHEQEADAQGLRMVYSLQDFTARGWSDEELPAVVDAAQRLGFSGLNITFPFKQAVLPCSTIFRTARGPSARSTPSPFRTGAASATTPMSPALPAVFRTACPA
jgi:shikimate dehydrogenase